jgi:hypothetical protein
MAMVAGRRRGRRVVITLVVVLLVLVGLFIAVDRVAAYAASQELAGQARKQLASREVITAGTPDVVIHGFPFLTQVVSGRYEKVSIDARQLATRDVTIDALDVTVTGIRVPASKLINRSGDITAADVNGTARIGWGEVAHLIETKGVGVSGVSVSAQPGGGVEMRTSVRVMGITAKVLATGTVRLSGDVVHVTVTDVRLQNGTLPPVLNSVADSVKRRLSVSVTIPELPYHLKISGVQSTVDGIVVSAYARNVLVGTH